MNTTYIYYTVELVHTMYAKLKPLVLCLALTSKDKHK